MTTRTNFVVGTRRSNLAMTQTKHVVELLQTAYPAFTFTIHEQDTKGDLILDVPLAQIGDKGLFTQELENGLLSGTIDLAVHSLKDLPTNLPDGLIIGAITERVSPWDVVVMRRDLVEQGITTLQQLHEQSDSSKKIIGTSSLRRQAQILARFPSLVCVDCRGNLDTRLSKLDRGDYAAIVLAEAGLARQGQHYLQRITQRLTSDGSNVAEGIYYAVGQGALGIECRAGDIDMIMLLSAVHHLPTAARCLAERALMRVLEGGCHAPIGVHSSIVEGTKDLTLSARVLSLDGRRVIESSYVGTTAEPEQLGNEAAKLLLHMGAGAILQDATNSNTESKTPSKKVTFADQVQDGDDDVATLKEIIEAIKTIKHKQENAFARIKDVMADLEEETESTRKALSALMDKLQSKVVTAARSTSDDEKEDVTTTC